MSANKKVISLTDVTHSYRSRDGLFSALRDVAFDLSAGQSCAIVGESGSGKSTLLNILGLTCIGMRNEADVVVTEQERCAAQ